MLQAASNIAPRGVYVCGNTTTTSGLTVTLVKEGGSGDFALEAGALVLADQGMCRTLDKGVSCPRDDSSGKGRALGHGMQGDGISSGLEISAVFLSRLLLHRRVR